jgi:hypothetical protein
MLNVGSTGNMTHITNIGNFILYLSQHILLDCHCRFDLFLISSISHERLKTLLDKEKVNIQNKSYIYKKHQQEKEIKRWI